MAIDYSKLSEFSSAQFPKECGEGSDAHLRGDPISINPYPEASREHDEWAAGWEEAEYYDDWRSM